MADILLQLLKLTARTNRTSSIYLTPSWEWQLQEILTKCSWITLTPLALLASFLFFLSFFFLAKLLTSHTYTIFHILA